MPQGLLAAITRERGEEAAVAGAVPIFYAKDEAEQRALARTLAHVLDGMVHELPNGILVIVRH